MGDERSASADLLARLTGVRSSKLSFYNKYRHTSASLDRSIRTLASTSTVLTPITAGPVCLVDGFVPAVASTLDAEWAALVAAHPAFPEQPYVVVGDRLGPVVGAREPSLEHLTETRDPHAIDLPTGQRAVPLNWTDEAWGWLAVQLPADRGDGDDTDTAILVTLANHVVTAVQSSHLLAEVSGYARQLSLTNSQLRRTQLALDRAREREIVETERQRLARELHDRVAQRVLAIGMALECCRGLATDDVLGARLREAQELARGTVATIRDAIFELSASDDLLPGGLVPSVRAMAARCSADGPAVSVHEQGTAVRMPRSTERALLIVVREALFNVLLHSNATRAMVRVAWEANSVVLEVADDGRGDPEQLSRHLYEALRSRSGHHQGLASVHGRIRELGGGLEVSSAPGGGVRLTVRVPIDPTPGAS
jgi:signal transduction histidine kinase